MKLASPREQKFDYVVGHGSENEGLASSIAHLISKYRPIDDRNHRYYRAYTEYAHTPTLCGPITRYQSPLQKTCGFNRSSLPEEANTLLVTSVFTNTTSIKDSIAAITQVKAKCLPYLLTYMNLTSLEKTHGLQIISAVQAPSETKQMAG